ncbi:ferritin subunit-like [Sitodiplosis mosellana]|uniref:ferritin subunit-like n=1 Tax=Sitodiplosis mosellana TaxID=263140 RepID=UPI002444E3A2|nr:ferritin subunit-like [Sitodiplosis mosellana]
MKMLIASVLVLFAVSSAQAEDTIKCTPPNGDVPEDFKDMTKGCFDKMRSQIQTEIDASMQYLAMGAHFAQDTINRPGFSEFFFKAAAEEREHSHKLIEYLLMRGNLTDGISTLITVNLPKKTLWTTGVEALKDALKYEVSVTKSIKGVIAQCEEDPVKTDEGVQNVNDYHLVDYLTGVYLEEQYHGQRDLAGKISTLDKLMKSHGPLGEFLYDKKLLE